jgi:hypothetical protein
MRPHRAGAYAVGILGAHGINEAVALPVALTVAALFAFATGIVCAPRACASS